MIRRLTTDDVAALQTIDAEAHGVSWSPHVFDDEIERSDRTHLVADLDGQVVGHASAWIDGASCRITNVAVASEHTRNGHAAALLASVLNTCLTTHRITNIQLEVRPSNRRAQRLYTRFGFVPVGVESDFYDHQDESGSCDAIVMAVADVCDSRWRTRLDRIERECTICDHDAGAVA